MPMPREPLYDPSLEPCVLAASDPGPRSPSGGNSPYNPLKSQDSCSPPQRKRRPEKWRCMACVLCFACTAFLAVLATHLQRSAGEAHRHRRSLDEHPNADAALLKVKQLVGAHMHDKGATRTERQVGADVAAGSVGDWTCSAASSVLDHATLQDALRTGSVITSDDLDRLAECRLGKHFRDVHMEEHDRTSSGIELVQGDLAVAGNGSSRGSARSRTGGKAGSGDGGGSSDGGAAGEDAAEHRQAERSLSGTDWLGEAWEGGEVRYCFAARTPQAARVAWRLAAEGLESQVPCLRFHEVKSAGDAGCTAVPSVVVTADPGDGCWSYLGRYSGGPHLPERSQPLNLGPGCEMPGAAAHQLGHALGLQHEQSRPERDLYMAVNTGAVRSGELHSFDVVPGLGEHGSTVQQSYDLLSVMHFPATAFSEKGDVTLMPRDPRVVPFLGQRMGFSFEDVKKLGSLYGCRSSTTPVASEELLTSLAVRTEGLLAPVTKGQCVCQELWATEGSPRCATAENGWCCNPDRDAQGPWCVTRGRCQGRVWDYCRPRSGVALLCTLVES